MIKLKNIINSVKSIGFFSLLIPCPIIAYSQNYVLIGTVLVVASFAALLLPLTVSLFAASSILFCNFIPIQNYNVNVMFAAVIALSGLCSYVTTEEEKLIKNCLAKTL